MGYNFDTLLDHRRNGSYRWGLPDMPADVIGMGTADLDYNCAPCIRAALMPVLQENCYNYRQRPEEYFEAVIGWYQRHYGLDVKKEWLSNVPGTIGAVRMALGIYAKPGDGVLVQTPVFAPLARAVAGAGCKLITNSLKIVDRHYKLDFEDFEEKIKTYHPSVFLMVNPHNPTGRVFSRKELEQLVSICSKYGVKIISDEVHSLILYDGNVHTPILAVNELAQEISIQIVSLSKGYNIMSLPHAIVTVAEPSMREAWNRQIQAFSFGYAVNSFAIAAVTSIMRGEADEWMTELNRYLDNNRCEAIEFMDRNKLPIIPVRPEGGFLLWIDCRKAGIQKKDLSAFFMDKTHIHLDDGAEFGSDGEGFVRMNYAVTNGVLKEALERIRKVFG